MTDVPCSAASQPSQQPQGGSEPQPELRDLNPVGVEVSSQACSASETSAAKVAEGSATARPSSAAPGDEQKEEPPAAPACASPSSVPGQPTSPLAAPEVQREESSQSSSSALNGGKVGAFKVEDVKKEVSKVEAAKEAAAAQDVVKKDSIEKTADPSQPEISLGASKHHGACSAPHSEPHDENKLASKPPKPGPPESSSTPLAASELSNSSNRVPGASAASATDQVSSPSESDTSGRVGSRKRKQPEPEDDTHDAGKTDSAGESNPDVPARTVTTEVKVETGAQEDEKQAVAHADGGRVQEPPTKRPKQHPWPQEPQPLMEGASMADSSQQQQQKEKKQEVVADQPPVEVKPETDSIPAAKQQNWAAEVDSEGPAPTTSESSIPLPSPPSEPGVSQSDAPAIAAEASSAAARGPVRAGGEDARMVDDEDVDEVGKAAEGGRPNPPNTEQHTKAKSESGVEMSAADDSIAADESQQPPAGAAKASEVVAESAWLADKLGPVLKGGDEEVCAAQDYAPPAPTASAEIEDGQVESGEDVGAEVAPHQQQQPRLPENSEDQAAAEAVTASDREVSSASEPEREPLADPSKGGDAATKVADDTAGVAALSLLAQPRSKRIAAVAAAGSIRKSEDPLASAIPGSPLEPSSSSADDSAPASNSSNSSPSNSSPEEPSAPATAAPAAPPKPPANRRGGDAASSRKAASAVGGRRGSDGAAVRQTKTPVAPAAARGRSAANKGGRGSRPAAALARRKGSASTGASASSAATSSSSSESESTDDEDEESDGTAGDEEDENSVTRCVCGDNDDTDGFMICCERCEVWQHGECVNVDPRRVPDKYYCERCEPEHPIHVERRKLEAQIALARQQAIQAKEQGAAGGSTVSTPEHPPAGGSRRQGGRGGGGPKRSDSQHSDSGPDCSSGADGSRSANSSSHATPGGPGRRRRTTSQTPVAAAPLTTVMATAQKEAPAGSGAAAVATPGPSPTMVSAAAASPSQLDAHLAAQNRERLARAKAREQRMRRLQQQQSILDPADADDSSKRGGERKRRRMPALHGGSATSAPSSSSPSPSSSSASATDPMWAGSSSLYHSRLRLPPGLTPEDRRQALQDQAFELRRLNPLAPMYLGRKHFLFGLAVPTPTTASVSVASSAPTPGVAAATAAVAPGLKTGELPADWRSYRLRDAVYLRGLAEDDSLPLIRRVYYRYQAELLEKQRESRPQQPASKATSLAAP